MLSNINPTRNSDLYPVPVGQLICAKKEGNVWRMRIAVHMEHTYQESLIELDLSTWLCPHCQNGNGSANCLLCGECRECCRCWYCHACDTRHKNPWDTNETETAYFQCRDCHNCEQTCTCGMSTQYALGTCFEYRNIPGWYRQAYKGKALCRDGIVRVFRLNGVDTHNSTLGVNECTVQAYGKKVRGIIEIKHGVVRFIVFGDCINKNVIKQKGKKVYAHKLNSDQVHTYLNSLSNVNS